jgi:hypothetical protein
VRGFCGCELAGGQLPGEDLQGSNHVFRRFYRRQLAADRLARPCDAYVLEQEPQHADISLLGELHCCVQDGLDLLFELLLNEPVEPDLRAHAAGGRLFTCAVIAGHWCFLLLLADRRIQASRRVSQ